MPVVSAEFKAITDRGVLVTDRWEDVVATFPRWQHMVSCRIVLRGDSHPEEDVEWRCRLQWLVEAMKNEHNPPPG